MCIKCKQISMFFKVIYEKKNQLNAGHTYLRTFFLKSTWNIFLPPQDAVADMILTVCQINIIMKTKEGFDSLFFLFIYLYMFFFFIFKNRRFPTYSNNTLYLINLHVFVTDLIHQLELFIFYLIIIKIKY